MKVLVIGNSTRSIVCSAKRAEHTVFSIDNFCDVDLNLCADTASPLEHATDSRIYELARTFGEIDGVILGTGFERLKFKNVLGNRIEVSGEVNDKLRLAKKLQTLGIPHPETEELSDAGGLKFPLMIRTRQEGDRFCPFGMKQEKKTRMPRSRKNCLERLGRASSHKR